MPTGDSIPEPELLRLQSRVQARQIAMRPPSQSVAITYLVLVAVSLVLIGLKFTIWSGLSIVISADGAGVVIDSTYLGEYHFGLERIRIGSESGQEVIVDIRDADGDLPNIFRLSEGLNDIKLRDGKRTTFVLEPNKTYVLTLCGNNSWGRTRCSSKSLRLPVGQLGAAADSGDAARW